MDDGSSLSIVYLMAEGYDTLLAGTSHKLLEETSVKFANPNQGGTTRVGFVRIINGKSASPFFGGLSVNLCGGKARKKH